MRVRRRPKNQLTDRQALDKRFEIADKIGEASLSNAIVAQGLSLIDTGRESPEDALCGIVRLLCESNRSISNLAIRLQETSIGGSITVINKDDGETEKLKAEIATKDARIAELEREVSILRSKARVRLAPGELG